MFYAQYHGKISFEDPLIPNIPFNKMYNSVQEKKCFDDIRF